MFTWWFGDGVWLGSDKGIVIVIGGMVVQ